MAFSFQCLNGCLSSLCCLKDRENQGVDADSQGADPKSETCLHTVQNRRKHNDWKLLSKLMDRTLLLVFAVLQTLLFVYIFPKRL